MASRILTGGSVAALALIAVLGSSVSPAAAEQTEGTGYERTAYDGTIWSVSASGAYPLSYQEWEALGFPAFATASTDYVRAAPFNTVYAVTWFETAQVEVTDHIDYRQYVAAGRPVPAVVPWFDGIEVRKWATSPELIATDSAGATAKLSYAQWSAADFPEFASADNRGFVAMSWDGSGAIAYMCDIAAGRGGRLTYDQWRSLGAPSPMRVLRTSADFVFKTAGSANPTVFYSGPIVKTYAPGQLTSETPHRALTFREWTAMGSPAPMVTNTTYPENWYCSSAYPTPWQ